MSPSQLKNSGEDASPATLRSKGWAAHAAEWNRRHPVLALVLMALLTVVINCYPVVFCGKSFVSPMSTGGALVYNWWPSLPGMTNSPAQVIPRAHGSDTEAMMWWGVPVGFMESRSVLEHGTIPLWNRYGHAGDTLMGQALSMLGDPLQWIVLLGRGAAGAWDIKFLAAKFLFCLGFGLLIRRLLGSQPLALIYTALAAYCGACFFINSHPVFFVLTYAPWILLAAVEWLDSKSPQPLRWGLVWLGANFACFNAGHVEVAVVLIGGLNLAAVTAQLIASRNRAAAVRVLGRIGLGALLFLGLTAPMWLSFLVAMEGAYTAHASIAVTQLSPTLLPGVFDDLFYLLLRSDDTLAALAPGASLTMLAGCSLSLTHWRELKGDWFFWINTVVIFLWGGVIFKWMPASLLAAIPLLNRVGHTHIDFSYLLIIHLTIQSAYGFRCLIGMARYRQIAVDLIGMGLAFMSLLILYSHGYWHQPIPWNYFLWAGLGAASAPLLFAILKIHQRQNLVVGWVMIIMLGFIPNFRFGLYTFGDDRYLMLPGDRVALNPPSRAVEKIKMDNSEPFRVVGLQWNFMGDYAAVYGLEDIRSCAPVSNGDYINLVRHFPGVAFSKDWKIQIVDTVRAQPLLNLLNVKYLLTRPQIVAATNSDFRIAAQEDFGVLENPQVWPRAFFVNQVTAIDSNESFIQLLSNNARHPFAALTEEEIKKQPGLLGLEVAGPATIIPAANYTLLPNSTEFDIHATSAGIVCLTEGQAKDFTARANKESKVVLTVNRAFKGIYLDKPGDYHIKFTYQPRYWRLACAVFSISAASVFLWIWKSLADAAKLTIRE